MIRRVSYRLSGAVALAALALLTTTAAASPAMRPAASGTTAPGLLWRFSTGERPLVTAPAVSRDGTVYAAAGDGALYAVGPDGRQRWSVATGVTSGTSTPARPAIAVDGTSYWSLQGSLVAVDPRGHVRWVFLASGGGPPVLARGRVLFAAGPYLYAVETTGPRAGRQAWRAAVGGTGGSSPTGGAPTPAVGPDGTAYVASSDGQLYAIAPDGLRRWTYRVGVPLLFAPAVGLDGTVYVDAFAGGHGTLYAVTAAGRPRWRLAVPAGGDVVRGPNGTVYVATHELLAVSPAGRVAWRRVVDAAAPVAAAGSSVLVATLAPASLLDLDTHGAVRWRLPLAIPVVGPPAFGPAGLLYNGDDAGTLSARVGGARGTGRLTRAAGRAAAAVDLGAGNPPFIVRGGTVTWRVTLTRAIERSADAGRHWRTVFTPGASLQDARAGLYHNARYADVTFVAVDPRDARGVYVGALGALGDYLSGGRGGADGGLYASADGVGGWRRLTSGLPYTYEPRLRAPAFGLDSLVFDPVRRGVLYAQTPLAYGSPGHDAGLYKSTDGGRQWRPATRGLTSEVQGSALLGPYRAYPSGALLVDRDRPNVLFLVAPTGFYRSVDGAARWARVTLVRYTDPSSVAVRIEGKGAVRVFTDAGAYLSADYGAHWRRTR